MGNDVTFSEDWHEKKAYLGNKFSQSDTYNRAIGVAFAAVGAADTAKDIAALAKFGVLRASKEVAEEALKTASKTSKLAKATKVGTFLGPASLVLEVGLAVTNFILAGDFSPAAFVLLIITIIMAVILFLISTIPVWVMGAIIAVFGLIDALLSIFFDGFSISGTVAQAIAEAIYTVEVLTEIDDIDFSGRKSELVDDEMGYVTGNRYRVNDTFVGSMKQTSSGGVDRRALEYSYICAEYAVTTTQKTVANNAIPKTACGWRYTQRVFDYTKRTVQYTNPLIVEFPLDEAGEVKVSFIQKIYSRSANKEKGWGGLITAYKTMDTTLPDDMPEKKRWKPTVVTLDVLPADSTEFWNSDSTFAPIQTRTETDDDQARDRYPPGGKCLCSH